jgi:hypothetical protein
LALTDESGLKKSGDGSWRKAVRPIIAVVAGAGSLYYTMEARADMYEAHYAACETLQRFSEHCGFDGSSWQLITIMANIGAISMGFIGWWIAPFTGLTDKGRKE